MAELGLPDNFQGAEPTLDIVEIPETDAAVGLSDWVFYQGAEPYYYRARYCWFEGRQIGGTVGALTMAFYAFQSGQAVLGVPALLDIPFDDSQRSFTWSTEAGNSYSGYDAVFSGQSCVMGLPLVAVKGPCVFQAVSSARAGGDGAWRMETGWFHVERFPPGSLGVGGGSNGSLYLLPGGG